MARASLHEFYVMTAKISPPDFFDVMADPMNYPDKSQPFKCSFYTRSGLHENYVPLGTKTLPNQFGTDLGRVIFARYFDI